MSRLVLCNLCDGKGKDADGNRCVDCAGLGRFPHWKQRPIGQIESDIALHEKVLRQELEWHEKNPVSEEPWKAAIDKELRDYEIRYWESNINNLKDELAYAKKRRAKDERKD